MSSSWPSCTCRRASRSASTRARQKTRMGLSRITAGISAMAREPTSRSIDHAYATPGTYFGKLTLIDNSGLDNGTVVKKFVAFVDERTNVQPVAKAGPDVLAIVGQRVDLDGGASSDSDSSLIGYHWDFGNGKSAEGEKRSIVYYGAGPLHRDVDRDGQFRPGQRRCERYACRQRARPAEHVADRQGRSRTGRRRSPSLSPSPARDRSTRTATSSPMIGTSVTALPAMAARWSTPTRNRAPMSRA